MDKNLYEYIVKRESREYRKKLQEGLEKGYEIKRERVDELVRTNTKNMKAATNDEERARYDAIASVNQQLQEIYRTPDFMKKYLDSHANETEPVYIKEYIIGSMEDIDEGRNKGKTLVKIDPQYGFINDYIERKSERHHGLWNESLQGYVFDNRREAVSFTSEKIKLNITSIKDGKIKIQDEPAGSHRGNKDLRMDAINELLHNNGYDIEITGGDNNPAENRTVSAQMQQEGGGHPDGETVPHAEKNPLQRTDGGVQGNADGRDDRHHRGQEGERRADVSSGEGLLLVLETLARLKNENREPDKEEREILEGYTSIAPLCRNNQPETSKEKRIMKALETLDPTTAENIYASYTKQGERRKTDSAEKAEAVWDTIIQSGFKEGSVLCLNAENGLTARLKPNERTRVTSTEEDPVMALISRTLAKEDRTINKGTSEAGLENEGYDVTVAKYNPVKEEAEDAEWKRHINETRDSALWNRDISESVKAIEKTRKGGLVILTMPTSLMDSERTAKIRQFIADECEIIGAVRSEEKEETLDTIILRKYNNLKERNAFLNDENYKKETLHPFLSVTEREVRDIRNPQKTNTVTTTAYYQAHPEMLKGQEGSYLTEQGSVITVTGGATHGQALKQEIAETLAKRKKLYGQTIYTPDGNNAYNPKQTAPQLPEYTTGRMRDDYITGTLVMVAGKPAILHKGKDGKPYYEQNDTTRKMERINTQVKDYMDVRDALLALTDAQGRTEWKEETERLRIRLHQKYENYIQKYGRLYEPSSRMLRYDAISSAVFALEKTETYETTEGCAEEDEEQRQLKEKRTFKTILTGMSDLYEHDIDIKRTNDSIEIPEEEANDTLTRPKQYHEIPVELGARWIDTEILTRFVKDAFGVETIEPPFRITYDPLRSKYSLSLNDLKGGENYWTPRDSAKKILKSAIRNKPITHTKNTLDGRTVVDETATAASRAKVAEMKEHFKLWVNVNPDAAQKITEDYNNTYTRQKTQKERQMVTAEGLSGMELRDFQARAVSKLMTNEGGILDHAVGAGKTLVMQTLAMELRHTGKATKPLMIVKNSTIEQIRQSFQKAYPSAHIMCPGQKDFTPSKRNETLEQIKNNDYDCIILSHNQFKMIKHSRQERLRTLRNKLEENLHLLEIETNEKTKTGDKLLKTINSEIEETRKEIRKLENEKGKEEICFEDLGIDHILVDECQVFKNLKYESQYKNIAGMGTKSGNDMANSLLSATEYLHRLHGGDRGVTLASATVITNSFTELYSIMQYVMPERLKQMNLHTFDAWASTFAQASEDLEYDVTGELETKTRFRKFTSLDILKNLYGEIADIVTEEDLDSSIKKPKADEKIIIVEANDDVKEMNLEIEKMVIQRNGSHFGIPDKNKKGKEQSWQLQAITLGRKLSISPKEIDRNAEDKNGKIDAVCRNIATDYEKWNNYKGVQVVFSDLSVKGEKKEWDGLTEIKTKLTKEYGIDPSQIADIHDYDTDMKRKTLLDKVNEGQIRVLMGGTENLGTGTNIQERLISIHHLDEPWTPAAIRQRNGRGIRQGNKIATYNGNKINIYHYCMNHSIDKMKLNNLKEKDNTIKSFQKKEIQTELEMRDNNDMTFEEMLSMMNGSDISLQLGRKRKEYEKENLKKQAFESGELANMLKYNTLREEIEDLENKTRIYAKDLEEIKKKGYVKDSKGNYPDNVADIVKDNKKETLKGAEEIGKRLRELDRTGEKYAILSYGLKLNIEPHPEKEEDGSRLTDMTLNISGRHEYRIKMQDTDLSWGTAPARILKQAETLLEKAEKSLAEKRKELERTPHGDRIYEGQEKIESLKREIEEMERQEKAFAEKNNTEKKRERQKSMDEDMKKSGDTSIRGKETKEYMIMKKTAKPANEEDERIVRTIKLCLMNAGIKIREFSEENKERSLSQTGTVAGYTQGGIIHINTATVNPNTYIHEYTHLWCQAMMINDPKRWEGIRNLLEGTHYWREVKADKNYSDIWDNPDRMASETLARLSGKRGEAWMRLTDNKQTYKKEGEKALQMFRTRAKAALKSLWGWTCDKLDLQPKDPREVADMVLHDLLDERHLKSELMRNIDRQFTDLHTTRKERAEIMLDCANHGLKKSAVKDEYGDLIIMEKADKEGTILIDSNEADTYRMLTKIESRNTEETDKNIRRFLKEKGLNDRETEKTMEALKRPTTNENAKVFAYITRPVTDSLTFNPDKNDGAMATYKDGTLNLTIALPSNPALQLYSTSIQVQRRGWGTESITDRYDPEKRERQMLIIGEKGAMQLDKELWEGDPSRIDNLRTAKKEEEAMNISGTDKSEMERRLWYETGWQRGADGKWRFELPDNDKRAITERIEEAIRKGEDTVECRIHDIPEMRSLYPNDDGRLTIDLSEEGSGSLYVRKTDKEGAHIRITYGIRETFEEQLEHELQHHCQACEGFAMGTTIKEVQSKKNDIADILGIKDRRDITAANLTYRYSTADEKTINRVKAVAEEMNIRLSDLLVMQPRQIYLNAMGEAEAENATIRMMLSEAEKMSTTLTDTEMRDRDNQWYTPKAMSAAAETMGWDGSNDYVDPEDEKWEYEQRMEEMTRPKTQEELEEERRYEEQAQRMREEARQRFEQELDKTFKGKDAVLYTSMTEQEFAQFQTRGYTLNQNNRLTAVPKRTEESTPVTLRIRIPAQDIKERITGINRDGSYNVTGLKDTPIELHSIRQSSEATYWDNRMRFCRKGNDTEKATPKQIEAMIKAIEKTFPKEMKGKVMLLSAEKYRQKEKEYLQGTQKEEEGSSTAFTAPDGTVCINRDEARTDTPLHELGIHRMMDIARTYGIHEIENAILTYGATAPTEIKDRVETLYPDIERGSREFLEECAAYAMGSQQEGTLRRMLKKKEEMSWMERLTDRVVTSINTLKNTVLGKQYADLSCIECLEGMSHEIIGRHLFSIVMSGKRIRTDNKIKRDIRTTLRHQLIGLEGAKRLALTDRAEDALTPTGLTLSETLERYERLKSEGVTDRNELTSLTGVMFGPVDGRERIEIMDTATAEGKELQRLADGKTERKAEEYFGTECNLTKAYPDINKEVRITALINPNIQTDFANIQENADLDGNKTYRITAFCQTEKSLKEKLTHEIQHYIQKKEGFDEGYPFISRLNGKEIMFIQEKLASRTATEIKQMAKAPASEYMKKGIRTKNIPMISGMFAKGKAFLNKAISKINEDLENYVYCAGENEAIAAERRLTLSRDERLAQKYDNFFLAPAASLRKSPINEFKEKLKMYDLYTPTLTFKQLRERISIIEIAESYGYRRSEKEGTRVPVYRHENGDSIAILNPANPAEQGYFNIHDSGDRGTLYNFIATRVSMGIIPNPLPSPESEDRNFVVNKIAHDYLRLPMEKREAARKLIRTAKRKEEIPTPEFGKYTEKLKDNAFLSRRNIKEAAALPEFEGKVLSLNKEAMTKDGIGGAGTADSLVAFPYTNAEGEIKALEKRGDETKLFFAGSKKSQAVWHSNIPEEGISRVIIFETPIDAMSYRLLNGKQEGTLYAATGGNTCAQQIDELLKTAKRNGGERAEIICANDTDLAGAQFNLKATLETMKSRSSVVTDQLPQEKGMSTLMISFKDEEGKKGLENIINNMEDVLKEKGIEIETDERNAQMRDSLIIRYNSNDRFSVSTLTALLQTTREGERIKTSQSVLKDWNEDLTALNAINEKKGTRLTYREMRNNKESLLTDPDGMLSGLRTKKAEKKTERKGMKL